MHTAYPLQEDHAEPAAETATSLSATELIALEEQYGAHNYHPLDVVIAQAQGAWVTDVAGRRYLDLLAAYSAVNQGHCHPAILAAMVEQAGKVTLTSRAFRNDQLPLLYRDLHQLTGYEMALPMNSGVEAVETALKVARKWAAVSRGIPDGEAEILVCDGNFHGRTIAVVGFSSEGQYRAGFGPFTGGFRQVAFGDADALRAAITPRTCAFLLEPIQGEAGILLPPEGYLREVEAICREHNLLLIVDEIQSGLGRTGRLFAYQHEGIQPDLVILGKALSGGFYPVSAVLSSRAILGVLEPGDHGSTFGGNPLACAVARAALRVLTDEQLPQRSATLGAYALARLQASLLGGQPAGKSQAQAKSLAPETAASGSQSGSFSSQAVGLEAANAPEPRPTSSGPKTSSSQPQASSHPQPASPYVVDVRGRGLWIGIELNRPARPFCEALQQRGVLCKETHSTVIRLAPPLIISRDDLAWALDQIEAVLT